MLRVEYSNAATVILTINPGLLLFIVGHWHQKQILFAACNKRFTITEYKWSG